MQFLDYPESFFQETHGPNKLMKSLDMLGLYAANKRSTNGMLKTVVTRSLRKYNIRSFLWWHFFYQLQRYGSSKT